MLSHRARRILLAAVGDFVATGDAKKGDTFEIRFALRNLGFR